MTRAATLLVVLGLAAAALLVWGGTRLQGIFAEERKSAEDLLSARRRTLAQFGLVALERRLHLALRQARPRIDAALEDPLLTGDGLLQVEGGVQHLPRRRHHLEGAETPSARLYEKLLATGAGDGRGEDGVWGERLALLDAFRRSLDGREGASDDEVRRDVRDILNHESRYAIPVTKALPYRLAFVDLFLERSAPDRSLIEALLRDGLRGTRGQRIDGLEPLLLANQERFTRADFEHLAHRISELAKDARVPHDDFDASVWSPDAEAVVAPASLSEPALVDRGRWFAEPLEVKGLRGVGVDLVALLREISDEMRAGGLLGPEDALTLREAPAQGALVTAIPLRVNAMSFTVESTEIARRYRLKTATGVALILLVVFVSGLVALLYRRERRYLEGKASLVATMSHELRTPIASLRLMGETLERRLEGVESARDFPSRIVKEADRLGFLVENILSFNRLEKTAVARNREVALLSELVEEARINLETFTSKPVELRLAKGGDVSLPVDTELVRLLFSNLMHNSCKYNASDVVKITLEATVAGPVIAVRHSDNGTGIPRHEWESVFTEFVRARNAGASGGFGLGLALCRRIMTLHDGTIRVIESGVSGTTLEMTFPAAVGASEPTRGTPA